MDAGIGNTGKLHWLIPQNATLCIKNRHRTTPSSYKLLEGKDSLSPALTREAFLEQDLLVVCPFPRFFAQLNLKHSFLHHAIPVLKHLRRLPTALSYKLTLLTRRLRFYNLGSIYFSILHLPRLSRTQKVFNNYRMMGSHSSQELQKLQMNKLLDLLGLVLCKRCKLTLMLQFGELVMSITDPKWDHKICDPENSHLCRLTFWLLQKPGTQSYLQRSLQLLLSPPRKGCGQLVLICYPAELPTWAQASSCICEFEDHAVIAITKGRNFICQ